MAEASNILPGIGGQSFTSLTQSMNGTLRPQSPDPAKRFSPARTGRPKLHMQRITAIIDGLSLAGLDPFGRGRDWALPGFTQVGCEGLGDSDGQDRPFGTYNIGDNITWIKGRHTLNLATNAATTTRTITMISARGRLLISGFSRILDVRAEGNGIQHRRRLNNGTVQDAVWGLLGGVFSESQTQLFNTGGIRIPSDERGFRERECMDSFRINSSQVKHYRELRPSLRVGWRSVGGEQSTHQRDPRGASWRRAHYICPSNPRR